MSKTLTCAIQFGTSSITAVAASRDEFGKYDVVAVETTASDGCIRHGNIVSTDSSAMNVKKLINKMNNRVKANGFNGISSAYVSINGMSMQTMAHHPSIQLPLGVNTVTSEIAQQLRLESQKVQLPDYEVLYVESLGYSQQDMTVTANNKLVIFKKKMKENIRAAMDRADVQIKGYVLQPLATAQILTAEEKQQGCLLIDLGASITTVSIYAEGVLQHLVSIPLGGDAVTNDIIHHGNTSSGQRQPLTQAEAEKAKIDWSDAAGSFQPNNEVDNTIAMPMRQGELNYIIQCRYEEIAANIAHQVELSGFSGKLASCVITGGAAAQKGLITLLSRQLKISYISVRGYSSIVYSNSDKRPMLTPTMAMIPYCKDDCQPDITITPVVNTQQSAASFSASASQQPAAARTTTAPAADGNKTTSTAAQPKTGKDDKTGKDSKMSISKFFGDLFSGVEDE